MNPSYLVVIIQFNYTNFTDKHLTLIASLMYVIWLMMSILLCKYSTAEDYPNGGFARCMGAREPDVVDTGTNSIQSSAATIES